METKGRKSKDEWFRNSKRTIDEMSNAMRQLSAQVIRQRIADVGERMQLGGREVLAVMMEGESDVYTQVYSGDGKYEEESVDGIFMEEDGSLGYINNGVPNDEITVSDMLAFLDSHDHYLSHNYHINNKEE